MIHQETRMVPRIFTVHACDVCDARAEDGVPLAFFEVLVLSGNSFSAPARTVKLAFCAECLREGEACKYFR
jgi:hypothetical protein